MSQASEKLHSIRDLCERFKVSDSTVRRWLRSGQLEAIEVGRQLRFEEKEIKRFLDARRRARHRRAG